MYKPERLALYQQGHGSERLAASTSRRHVDTSEPKGSQSSSLLERALSPKTAYEPAEDNRQVPRPIHNTAGERPR